MVEQTKLVLVEDERVEDTATSEVKLIGEEENISEEVEGKMNMEMKMTQNMIINKKEGTGSKQIKVLEPELKPCCESPNLIPDQKYGAVCSNCGTVREQLVFAQPNYQKDNTNTQIDKKRCKNSNANPNLLRALKFDRKSYKEKVLIEAKSFIFQTADLLNLTELQATESLYMFKKIWEQKNNKGIEIHAMMIAAMYTNLKSEGYFIPIKIFIDLYDMDKAKVENAIARIGQIIQSSDALKDKRIAKLNEDYPTKLLDSIYELMGLHEKIYKNAKKIIESNKCAQKLKLENKNNPYALVAGALYLACQIVKGRIPKGMMLTQDMIAEKLDITVVTLREYYQFLYEIFEEQINRSIQKFRTATTSTEEEDTMKRK